MPRLSLKEWLLLCLCAILGVLLWVRLLYPQLAFLNLRVDRAQALKIAKQYLHAQHPETKTYHQAVVFRIDTPAHHYLQHTLGYAGLKAFIQEHDFDGFFWIIRFFKEHQKEEFRVSVSASSGEVIGYKHSLPTTAVRPTVTKEEARQRAVFFLKDRFAFNESLYALKKDSKIVRDHRADFLFTWRKKAVAIPWCNDPQGGTGKLTIDVVVSGDEVLTFSKNNFLVPEKFNRFIAHERNIGKNILQIIKILSMLLLIAAVSLLVVRHNHMAMHLTKKFYLGIVMFLFFCSLMSFVNQWQQVLYAYKTVAPMQPYFVNQLLNLVLASTLAAATILIPSLAGELLHYENDVQRNQQQRSLLHYARSTFLSREVATKIALGYLFFLVLIGLQAVLIRGGQRYLGVWVEQSLIKNISTATWPCLAALFVALKASVSEEVLFRLFAINLGKKFLHHTLAAVILSALIWGFAHSLYPVFPIWFRCVEVSILGLLFSFIYLRHGLITAIVAHYVFDVFWFANAYLFGHSTRFNFWSTLLVFLLPLGYAGLAAWINRSVKEKTMRWQLNKNQQYNLQILKGYIAHVHQDTPAIDAQALRQRLSANGWDIAVIDIALEDHTDS